MSTATQSRPRVTASALAADMLRGQQGMLLTVKQAQYLSDVILREMSQRNRELTIQMGYCPVRVDGADYGLWRFSNGAGSLQPLNQPEPAKAEPVINEGDWRLCRITWPSGKVREMHLLPEEIAEERGRGKIVEEIAE